MFRLDEQTAVEQFGEVFTLFVNGGPHRHDNLGAHSVQLVAHCFWVRPVFCVKFPIALSRPVEKVNHNHIKRNSQFLVFSCHAKHFLLRPVAQLALPESEKRLVDHGCSASHFSVVLQDFCGIVIDGNPVVELFCGLGFPLRIVSAKHDIADARMIPQKAIAETGHRKWDRSL